MLTVPSVYGWCAAPRSWSRSPIRWRSRRVRARPHTTTRAGAACNSSPVPRVAGAPARGRSARPFGSNSPCRVTDSSDDVLDADVEHGMIAGIDRTVFSLVGVVDPGFAGYSEAAGPR